MQITESEKTRLKQIVNSDVILVLQKIAKNIIERSWKMRVAKETADETLKTISYAEGMEYGANEFLHLIDTNSK